jgi:hypothetical protein
VALAWECKQLSLVRGGKEPFRECRAQLNRPMNIPYPQVRRLWIGGMTAVSVKLGTSIQIHLQTPMRWNQLSVGKVDLKHGRHLPLRHRSREHQSQ